MPVIYLYFKNGREVAIEFATDRASHHDALRLMIEMLIGANGPIERIRVGA